MPDLLMKKWGPVLLGSLLALVAVTSTSAWQRFQRSQHGDKPDQEPQTQYAPANEKARPGGEGPDKTAPGIHGPGCDEAGEAVTESTGPNAAMSCGPEPDEPTQEIPKSGPRSAWEEEAPNQAALASLEPPRQPTPDGPPQRLDLTGWLQAAAATHPGKVRSGNEDRFLLETWGDGTPAVVAAVFDGMGGHGGGDLAAQVACHTVLDHLQRNPPPDGDPARHEVLLRALGEADRAIRWRGKRELGRGGMGTTAVVALLTSFGALHLYCGDSRLYHYRDGRILHRTRDHSIVQLLLDHGKIKPEEVATHSMRSQLTTCLGGGGDSSHAVVEPVWNPADTEQGACLDLQPGDLVLLCSDGLCGEISAEDLDRLVADHGQAPQALVEACIQAALGAGGRDNVTVIALRWKGE